MIRIFEKSAIGLITLLVNHLQSGGRNHTGELAGICRENVERFGGYKFFGDEGNVVKEALYQNAMDRTAPTVPELLRLLGSAVFRGGADPQQDQTLVDTIAKILRMPYSGNRITGGNLNELSDVILRPDERLADVLKKLQSVKCAKCGDQLVDAQMVTFYTGAAMDGDASVFCQVCAMPQMVKCSTKDCFEKVEYQVGMKIHEVKCYNCTNGRTPQNPEAELRERFRGLGYMTGAAQAARVTTRNRRVEPATPAPIRFEAVPTPTADVVFDTAGLAGWIAQANQNVMPADQETTLTWPRLPEIPVEDPPRFDEDLDLGIDGEDDD